MLYLILSSLLMAAFGPIDKMVSQGLNPSMVACLFCLVSTLLFLPFFRTRQLSLKLTFQLMGVGALEFGVMYQCFQLAIKDLYAHEVALLLSTTPIYIVLCEAFFKKKYVLHRLLLGGCVAGISFIVLGNNGLPFPSSSIIFSQISNFAFAMGQIALRHLFQKYHLAHSSSLSALLFLGAFLVSFLFFPLFHSENYLNMTASDILKISLLGIFGCGVSHFLWNKGVLRTRPMVLAVMNNIQIPLTIIIACVFLKEPVQWRHLLYIFSFIGIMGCSYVIDKKAAQAALKSGSIS